MGVYSRTREEVLTETRDEERLSALMLFQSLGPKEAGEINRLLETVALPEGERLFEEGDPGDALYIIRDGAMDILKRSRDGEEQVIASLGKFAMLGEMSLITEAPRSATAVAKQPCRLFRLSKARFLDLIQKDSLPAYKICLAIARFLSHRLGQLDEKLVSLLEKSQAPEVKASLKEFTDFKVKLFSQWKED